MKKLKSVLFSLLFLLPCLFFCGCGDSNASIVKISVSLADINKTIEDNTLKFTYGDEINLANDQFVVTATYDNYETGTLNVITESNPIGYFRESDIPNISPIPAGEYYLKFCHNTLTPVEITIIVEKAKIDMSAVKWNYSTPLTYNTENQSVELTNLPSTVTAVYNGNTAKNTGKYTAVASYEFDRDNYEMINNNVKALDWEIKKCPINLQNTKWNYTTPFDYDGQDKTVELINIPDNLIVEYKNKKGTYAGTYTTSCKFIYESNNYELVNNRISDCTWEIKASTAEVKNLSELTSALNNSSYNRIEIKDNIELTNRITINKDIIINPNCKITLSQNSYEPLNFETVFIMQNNAKITQYVSAIDEFKDAFKYADKIILTEDLVAENSQDAQLKFVAENKHYNIIIDLAGHNLKYNFEFTNMYTEELESTKTMTVRFINSNRSNSTSIKHYLGYSSEADNIAIKVDGNSEFYIYLPIEVVGGGITLNGRYEIATRDDSPRGNIITN